MREDQPPFAIRRLGAHEWPLYRSLRLRSLEDAPYAFGSTLAAEQHRPAALWQARLIAARPDSDCPLIAEGEGAALGMVWGKGDATHAGIVHVYQMWVAPEARGRGIAAALLDGVVQWARACGARMVELAVSEGNDAAAALYRRAGFQAIGAPAALHQNSPMLSQRMQLDLHPDGGPDINMA